MLPIGRRWAAFVAAVSLVGGAVALACVGEDADGTVPPAADASTQADSALTDAAASEDATVDAAVFQPNDLPGCALWFRGDLGVTVNASQEVTKWTDQSGAADPTHDLNAMTTLPTRGMVGGKPAIVLTTPDPTNAKGAFLKSAPFSAPLATPLTYYAVVATPGVYGAATSGVVFDGLGVGFQRLSFKPDALLFEYNAGVGLVQGTSLAVPAAAKTLLVTMIYDVTQLGTSMRVKVSGGGVFTGPYVGANFSSAARLNQIIVGANSVETTNLQGSLAELIAFRAAHTPTDRAAIEAYLTARYGIQ